GKVRLHGTADGEADRGDRERVEGNQKPCTTRFGSGTVRVTLASAIRSPSAARRRERHYGQTEQPTGQGPLIGAVHAGGWLTGLSTRQQSMPGAQHWVSQQNSDPVHCPPSQGGVLQCPLAQ